MTPNPDFPENSPEIRFFLENSRAVTTEGPHGAHGGPWASGGPHEAHGGPLGATWGFPLFSPYSPSWARLIITLPYWVRNLLPVRTIHVLSPKLQFGEKVCPCEERPAGPEGLGAHGAHGGPMGAPWGPPGGFPYFPPIPLRGLG